MDGYYCQVNGEDLHQATEDKAVLCLNRPASEIHILVRHDPPQPDGLQVTSLLCATLSMMYS